MPFKKGTSGNSKGRPKGAKSTKSEAWKALASDIINKHTTKFNKTLNSMEDEEFVETYLKILKYFKPQLSSTEIKADITLDKEKIKDIFPEVENNDKHKG